jgi:hypothetical protein
LKKKIQLKEYYLFLSKIAILLIPTPKASFTDVQAAGEAFSPQKRTSSISKNVIY